ncbi:sugar ABC transporter [Gracilibacillus boraciitolerans JCM 21714]|uniref:Sugar ABC transporter n=2 Tax=Gracilibacillus boraciitolerans TaxID=307521 RepID=W4VL05_9BACI|nr:sugar ABC transporter [Gracilibacillus boraciitolerans JCM 21714]
MPSLLGGSVAIAILWKNLFEIDGLINQVLAFFNIQGQGWISHPDYALGTIIILATWQFGASMVIFLAGLKQIPKELYEAAAVDGGTKRQVFFRVTLPLLSPVIFFNLVIELIKSIQVFTSAFIISEGTGGPINSTLFYTLYLYQKGFTHFEMGYASAMAWILVFVLGVMTLVIFFSSKYWVHYEDGGETIMDQSTKTSRLLTHLFIILFGLFMLYPVVWMVASSFKPETLIFSSPSIFSKEWTISNYTNGWNVVRNVNFGQFFKNSFLISMIAVIANLITCSMAAYAFARLKFPLKKLWFACMLMTIMLPAHATLIPQYTIFHNLEWVNTILPLTVPKVLATDAFFIFLMVQFFRGIPRELDESAIMDGCGVFQVYARIIMPLAVPVLITTAIFTFIWTWDDFFSQILYLNTVDNFTVPLGLRLFLDSQGESSWGSVFAMSVLSLIPITTVFFIFQRYIVEGIATTGIKG